MCRLHPSGIWGSPGLSPNDCGRGCLFGGNGGSFNGDAFTVFLLAGCVGKFSAGLFGGGGFISPWFTCFFTFVCIIGGGGGMLDDMRFASGGGGAFCMSFTLKIR